MLDPGTWPDDETLVFAVPSSDGALVAYGVAVGSTHNAAIRIRDVATGRDLPDRPRGANHASVAWLPDGSGFLYVATPDPSEAPPGEQEYWEAIYEHRIGSSEPARRVFGSDDVKEYWCSVETSECGRFAVLYLWDFVHANTVHLLRLADGAIIPVAPAMRSLNRVQVIDDLLLIHTDALAPRGRVCVAPLDAPQDWRTLIDEGSDILQSVTGIGGRLYAVHSVGAAHHVRVYDTAGQLLREIALPALGSVNSNFGDGTVSGVRGSWTGRDVWLNFESFVQPPSVYRYDYPADELRPYCVPDVGLGRS